jgi:Arc/MetJ family transcription regulator
MRTTLAIDDDVLAAARALAEQQKRSIGEVVSDLARRSLRRPVARAERNGVPLLPMTNPAAQVTLEMVNQLRDEAP